MPLQLVARGEIVAPLVRDERDDERQHDQQDLQRQCHTGHRHAQLLREHVLPARDEQHDEERQDAGTDRGAHGPVTRTVEQVVDAAVSRHPGFEEGPRVQQAKGDARQHDTGPEHLRNGVRPDLQEPRRRKSQRAFEPTDVPVGLGRGRHRRRFVGAVQPDGVDLREPTEQCARRGHERPHRDALGGVGRPQWRPDDVGLGVSRPCELCVLLTPDDREVCAQQSEDQQRHDEHVHDEQAAERRLGRILAAEEQECEPRAHDGHGQDDRVGDAQPRTREEVVREGVAGEAVCDREQQQRAADEPVDLARLPKRAGEEDAPDMGDDRGQEEQRRPMVHLPEQQPHTNVEAQVDDRPIGRRHADAAQRHVRAAVHDVLRAGGEEQREERPGRDENDEAVHRDLAEQERPMVRERLVEGAAREVCGTEALVDPASDGVDHLRHGERKST